MNPDLPHPLDLSAAEFAAGYRSVLPGGERELLDRYARIFRAGDLAGLECPIAPVARTHVSESHEGAVVKFTQTVAGRTPAETLETESVLIPMIGKRRIRAYTLCVSSQVGCAMGCTFCQTAQMGLVRSLAPHEIVQQWFAARWLVERPDPEAEIRNIVFMGMGEPMDNYENVIQAVRVLKDHRGPAIAPSRITISTVGCVDGILKMARQVQEPGWHRLGLAISLNAPSDEVRAAIMPVNRAWPLAKLREVLALWPTFGSSHLCLEYVLIPGVNDGLAHADQLAAYVKGREFGTWEGAPQPSTPLTQYDGLPLKGIVNLIPYNPRENSPWPAPTEESVDAFLARLTAQGVYCKRRRTKGRDQMAACGQLGNLAYRRKRVALTVSE